MATLLSIAISTAISGVTANAEKADVNAPVYNLAGQQVSKAYKLIVLQMLIFISPVSIACLDRGLR